MNIGWTLLVCFLRAVIAQDANCDFYQKVNATNTYFISSPGYPNRYRGGVKCRWIAECPDGYNCQLNCPLIEIPESPSCSKNRLLVSKSGDPQLHGADKYCGRGSLNVTSNGPKLSVGLISSKNSRGGRFRCALTAVPRTTQSCRCGERRQDRIVGGEETGVNEYKMMAGLVDVRISQIKCGAVIISNNFLLTAAHCVINMNVNETAVVVGEHNVDTGDDTPATRVYTVASFRIHPLFTESNYDYDIAIIRVTQSIEFNDRVGTVCLPFKFVNTDFSGSKVTVLGWGTQSFGGPDSKVLLKAELDVISQNRCLSYEPRVTPRQICTLTPGKDACQDDSGGPLLYMDPATKLLHSVGIVSFGRFCAADSPGINTRVPMFLDWITATAPDNYCIK